MEKATGAKAAQRTSFSHHFKRKWRLYALLVLPVIMVFIFQYIPLYGLVIAFQDYNPALGMLV